MGQPQLPGELSRVDVVPVFPHHVHHVDGDDHGDAQLHELGGQVQVALQVGASTMFKITSGRSPTR